MKKFLPQEGGHRLYNNDFITMQDGYIEALTDICKMFKRSGEDVPMVMHGVTPNVGVILNQRIYSNGAIFFINEIFRIETFTINNSDYQNIFLKIIDVEIPNIDPIRYKDNLLKYNIHIDRVLEAKIFNASDGDLPGINGFYLRNLTTNDTTPRNVFCDWLPIDSIDFANSFDSTGLGIGRMSGWAVCNGNNGTIDLRGQYTVMASNNMLNNNAIQTIAINNINYNTRIGNKTTNFVINVVNLPNYNLNVIDPGHQHIYSNWPNNASIGQGGTSASSNKQENSTLTAISYTNIQVNSGGSSSPISVNLAPPSYVMIKIQKIR